MNQFELKKKKRPTLRSASSVERLSFSLLGLEHEFRAQLNEPGVRESSNTTNSPEGPAGHISRRICEIGVVEEIVEFAAQLQGLSFRNFGVLLQREVHV